MDKRLLLQLTADIVASHASMNEMGQEDLLGEIDLVYNKLANLVGDGSVEVVEAAPAAPAAEAADLAPAVPLEAAFTDERVFCLVCGKGMKTLKRHLSTSHQMTPREYRKAFGIPTKTPLVAKNYSETRKQMAKDLKLADRLVGARAARGKKKG